MTNEKTFGDLEIELADATKKLAKYRAKEHMNYVQAIKRFGDKFTDEELKNKTNEELETIHDAVSRFGTELEVKAEDTIVIPMGQRIENDEMPVRVDFAHVFDDVLSDFNMSNIKIKQAK